MNDLIYMAPMEGVTDSIFRNTFEDFYGGVDKYFTPFLTPNETFKFTTREWKEIDPEKNNIEKTVPQVLTNKHEHFLWAAQEISKLGYKEINFNLGCPSGTVVAKGKGSGFLADPEKLDSFFDQLFDGLSKQKIDVNISLKTRLGKDDPEDFYEILKVFNRYPFCEITIHPRITKDFYKEPLRLEYFDYALANSKAPLVFNGELNLVSDILACQEKYPDINGVMLGRGLISNPGLAQDAKEKEAASLDFSRLLAFHDNLLEQYIAVLSGEKPVLYRMKEFWYYWEKQFDGNEKTFKKIRKANRLADYRAAVRELL